MNTREQNNNKDKQKTAKQQPLVHSYTGLFLYKYNNSKWNPESQNGYVKQLHTYIPKSLYIHSSINPCIEQHFIIRLCTKINLYSDLYKLMLKTKYLSSDLFETYSQFDGNRFELRYSSHILISNKCYIVRMTILLNFGVNRVRVGYRRHICMYPTIWWL